MATAQAAVEGRAGVHSSPVAALVVEVDLFIVPQEGDVGFAQHERHAGDGVWVVKGFGSILQQQRSRLGNTTSTLPSQSTGIKDKCSLGRLRLVW